MSSPVPRSGPVAGHGAKFSHKKEQAIAALLMCRNVETAARTAGIGVNTLSRWMKDPEFEAAYREARRLALAQAVSWLQDAAGAAVKTVLKTMCDPHASAGTRLRAAAIVLGHAFKALDSEGETEQEASSALYSHTGSPILPWPAKKALPAPTANAETDKGA